MEFQSYIAYTALKDPRQLMKAEQKHITLMCTHSIKHTHTYKCCATLYFTNTETSIHYFHTIFSKDKATIAAAYLFHSCSHKVTTDHSLHACLHIHTSFLCMHGRAGILQMIAYNTGSLYNSAWLCVEISCTYSKMSCFVPASLC